MSKSLYSPREGYEWNPLKGYRNIPCPCGSGVKAKRCCGQFDTLPVKVAEKIRAHLKRRFK